MPAPVKERIYLLCPVIFTQSEIMLALPDGCDASQCHFVFS